MNQFINKILKESKEINDPFFHPKDIQKREEEEKRKIEEKKKIVFSKIQSGLENIKEDYKNKNWGFYEEELFLEIFSKLYLSKKYSEKHEEYNLLNEKNKRRCVFNLKYDRFWVSYEYIWKVFAKELRWKDDEIQQFINDMFKKHFKLYEFTLPDFCSFI